MRRVAPIASRLVSALLALAVIAVGVVALIEVSAGALERGFVILGPDTGARLRHTTWDSPGVQWTIAALGAAGLVALVLAIWPRPPAALATDDPDVHVDRRSLEQTLGRLLDRVDGVTAARVRARRDGISARVDTKRRSAVEPVRTAAHDTIRQFLDRNGLDIKVEVALRERAPVTPAGSGQ
jgi:uncharacterized protein DUF6286